MAPTPDRGRHVRRAVVAVVVTALAALVVLPLVWPVPPLAGTVDPRSLAYPDSRFATIGALDVHYRMWGWPTPSGATSETDGIPTAAVLLHGFGASTFSWEPVATRLGDRLPVLAFDRPGYGLTSRPLSWTGADPYSVDAQAELVIDLMDRLGVRRAVLIGHSAGAQVAVLAAARHPTRVRALVLEDPAIFAGGPPAFVRPLLLTPQMMRIGPLISRQLGGQAGIDFIRSAWHDPSRISSATVEGYTRPLRARDWDRALWSVTVAPRPADVPALVARLSVPALVVSGDDDRIVPPADSRAAASLIRGSRFVMVPRCGHLPHEEQPDEFLRIVAPFLDEQGATAPRVDP